MERIHLPYLAESIKIAIAFEVMSRSGEHAVVIRHQARMPGSQGSVIVGMGTGLGLVNFPAQALPNRDLLTFGDPYGNIPAADRPGAVPKEVFRVASGIPKFIYRLYTNALLIEGLQNDMTVCQELALLAGEPVLNITKGDLESNPGLTSDKVFEIKMDEEGHQYAVFDAPNPSPASSILVITRHESVKYALQRVQTLCYCTVSPNHKIDMNRKVCRVCSGPLKCG